MSNTVEFIPEECSWSPYHVTAGTDLKRPASPFENDSSMQGSVRVIRGGPGLSES